MICLALPTHVFAQSLEQLFKEGAYEEMISKYSASFRDMNIKDLILLSTAYARTDNQEEQIKILEQILKVKPKYFKVHYQLAEINKDVAYSKIKSGKFYPEYEENLNKMTYHYKAAMQIEPKNILPYRGMMEVIKDQENVNEGIALSKQMIKLFKETPETLMYACFWNSKFGLVEQTRRACQKASSVDSSNPEPLVLIARTYEDSGEKDKYNEIILDLFKKFPDDTEVIKRAGLIHYENKDYYSAEMALRKNKNTEDEPSLVYFGFSLFEGGKYEESLAHLSKTCEDIEDSKKDMIRFYEGNLRRLEKAEDQGMQFKFQRALNQCKTLVVDKGREIKVRAGHFEEGIRLPANAKSLSGATLREKREAYDMQRRKGGEFKPSASAQKQMSGE